MKRLVKKYQLSQVLALEFITAAAVTFLIALFFRVDLTFKASSLAMIAVGCLAFIGSVGKTKALSINMASTAVTQSFAPLLPIILAVIFMGEGQYFNVSNNEGILRLIALSLMPFSILLLGSDKLEKRGRINFIWIFSALIFLLSDGLVTFLVKHYLNVNNAFMFSSYYRLGKALAASGYLILRKGRLPMNKTFFKQVGGNGVLVALASLLGQLGLALAPISIFITIKKPSYIILSTLAGLYLFKENEDLSKKELLGFILSGVVLAIMIYTSG